MKLEWTKLSDGTKKLRVISECNEKDDERNKQRYECRKKTQERHRYLSMLSDVEKLKERLEKYIDKKSEDECWNWTGHLDSSGYGRIAVDGKSILAHRIIWTLINGEVPIDKPLIIHTCDNRRCCNPKHLKAGTHQDNMDDKVERNRCYRPPTGENHPLCMIPDIIVEEIRKEYNNNKKTTIVKLAKKYNVSKSETSRIVRNESRKDENYKPELRSGTEGQNNSHAKLTWKEVNEIREKHKNGKNISELMKEYNMSRGAISHIVNYITWKP